MARMNVYIPDDLAAEARAAGINVSRLVQEALRGTLDARRSDEWLDRIAALEPLGIAHREVLDAVAEAKLDFDRRP